MRIRLRLIILALANLSCGYTLVRNAPLPGGAHSLSVQSFTNLTAQAEAGGLFTAAARNALAAHGRLAHEGDPNAGQLQGELRALSDTTSSLGATGASAFRLEALVQLRIIGEAGTQGILYEDLARSSEDYLQGEDVLGTEANRRAAMRRLADKLMRETLERLELSF